MVSLYGIQFNRPPDNLRNLTSISLENSYCLKASTPDPRKGSSVSPVDVIRRESFSLFGRSVQVRCPMVFLLTCVVSILGSTTSKQGTHHSSTLRVNLEIPWVHLIWLLYCYPLVCDILTHFNVLGEARRSFLSSLGHTLSMTSSLICVLNCRSKLWFLFPHQGVASSQGLHHSKAERNMQMKEVNS